MTAPVDFALGHVCRVVLGDAHPAVLPQIVQSATIISQVSADTTLLAWPDVRCGMLCCVVSRGEGRNLELTGWWPFSTGHDFYEFRIDRVHVDIDTPAIAICDGAIEDLALTVFDTRCRIHNDQLTPGDVVRVDLHGWALKFSKASNEPIVIRAEDAGEHLRQDFTEAFERDGELRLETSKLAAIFPFGDTVSPLHEIRGIVRRVMAGPKLLDVEYAILTVIAARIDEAGDLTMNVTVPLAMLGNELPQEGEAVQGIIWLQANLSPKLNA